MTFPQLSITPFTAGALFFSTCKTVGGNFLEHCTGPRLQYWVYTVFSAFQFTDDHVEIDAYTGDEFYTLTSMSLTYSKKNDRYKMRIKMESYQRGLENDREWLLGNKKYEGSRDYLINGIIHALRKKSKDVSQWAIKIEMLSTIDGKPELVCAINPDAPFSIIVRMRPIMETYQHYKSCFIKKLAKIFAYYQQGKNLLRERKKTLQTAFSLAKLVDVELTEFNGIALDNLDDGFNAADIIHLCTVLKISESDFLEEFKLASKENIKDDNALLTFMHVAISGFLSFKNKNGKQIDIAKNQKLSIEEVARVHRVYESHNLFILTEVAIFRHVDEIGRASLYPKAIDDPTEEMFKRISLASESVYGTPLVFLTRIADSKENFYCSCNIHNIFNRKSIQESLDTLFVLFKEDICDFDFILNTILESRRQGKLTAQDILTYINSGNGVFTAKKIKTFKDIICELIIADYS